MQRTFDILKLCLLGLLITITIWSASKKVLSTLTLPQTLASVKYNFDKCNIIENTKFDKDSPKYQDCKIILTKAFDDSKSKCKKYLDILNYCKLNIKKGCENFENNLNSCVNMIIVDRLNDWTSKVKLNL